MKTKDMIGVALMCIGSWCVYHAYSLYHSFPSSATRAVANAVHSGITRSDVTVFAYAIGGIVLIITSFFVFGDRKKKR